MEITLALDLLPGREFHFLYGYIPFSRFEVDFFPFRVAKFAGTHKDKGGKLKGAFDYEGAFKVVNCAKSGASSLRLGERREVLFNRLPLQNVFRFQTFKGITFYILRSDTISEKSC